MFFFCKITELSDPFQDHHLLINADGVWITRYLRPSLDKQEYINNTYLIVEIFPPTAQEELYCPGVLMS